MSAQQIEIAQPKLPDPTPIRAIDFNWKVKQFEGPYFCLTAKDYENLSLTMAETIRWVKEAQWRLEYYNPGGEENGP